MSARDDILGTIRRSLGVTGRESIRRQIVTERLERSPRASFRSADRSPAMRGSRCSKSRPRRRSRR